MQGAAGESASSIFNKLLHCKPLSPGPVRPQVTLLPGGQSLAGGALLCHQWGTGGLSGGKDTAP